MKSPEPPNEQTHGVPPKQRPVEAHRGKNAPDDDESFVPVYVQMRSSSSKHGGRNLLLGGLFFLLALGLLPLGTLLAGPRALVPVVTCLAVFGLLWMLARVHLFKQRNGPFLALAFLTLVGSSMAIFEHGYDLLAERLAASATLADATATLTPLPVPPVARPLPGSSAPKAASADAVEPGEAPLPAMSPKELEAAITAADKEETPAQITQRAQKEAIRRYPALGIKASAENEIFIETYRELRNNGSELLKDPEWPLDIAESLARKEGWERK